MIERGPRPERNFLIVQNDVLRDERLSFKARGVLVFLLSQPPGYQTSAERIASASPDGRHAVLSALRELETTGYLERHRRRLPNGRFQPVDIVHDQPLRDQPEAGNWPAAPPAVSRERAGQTGGQFSEVGKPADKILELTAEELTPEELHPRVSPAVALDDDFDRWWAAYPEKRGKGAARKAWPKALVRVQGDAERLIAAARRLDADPNRDPRYTPYPSTWLNQERWDDPPLPSRSGSRATSGDGIDLAAQRLIDQEAAASANGSFPHQRPLGELLAEAENGG